MTNGKLQVSDKDLGCWADGALGHDRCRMVLANVLANCFTGPARQDGELVELLDSLDSPPADDFYDEELALCHINESLPYAFYLRFLDGDLILMKEDLR